MKAQYFLFLLLFCSMSFPEYDPKKEKIFYETIGSFIKKKQKCGFEPHGVGGGESKERHNYGKHNSFNIFFHIQTKLTIESARKLAVETVKEFLAHINANEKIRNDLIEYPLTEKYVYIAITGEDIDINDAIYIKNVSAGGGQVSYRIDCRSDIHEETFREAEQILKEQFEKRCY